MSFFEYSQEEARNIIVSDTLLLQEEPAISSDLKKTQHDLRKLLERDLKLKWHIVSLSDYWREKRIPRGLRISKFPSSYNEDPTFRAKWESILNKCSMDLMLLLIEDGKAQRVKLEAEIGDKRATLSTLPSEELASIESKLKDNLRELEQSVKKLKLQKFKRDVDDYENARVYHWRKTKEYTRERRGRHVSFNLYSSDDDGLTSNTDQDFSEDDRQFPPLGIQHGSARRAGGGDARRQPTRMREGLRKKTRVQYPR